MKVTENTQLLGIRSGQIRHQDLVHNASWYNRKGEKVGWGDLDPKDLVRIPALLDEGEVFVVLGEHDSYWNLPGGRKHESPGLDFLAEKARYLLTSKGILRPTTDTASFGLTGGWSEYGVTWTSIDRSTVIDILEGRKES